jgi:Ca2+-binding EF-hand superfamily protein
MTRKTLIAVSMLAVLASGAAFAAVQPAAPAQPANSMHAKLDKNGDGAIDRTEAANAPWLTKRFDSIDTNKDGKLATDEMQQARMQRGGGHRGWRHGQGHGHDGMGMKLDTDKDGRISSAEAAGAPKFAERFETMDANKDGFVDRADFQARMAQRRDECFGKADADQDGKLSRDEFARTREVCHPQMHHGDGDGTHAGTAAK